MKKLLHKSLSAVLVLTLVLGLFSGLSFQSSATDLAASGSCGDNVNYYFDASTGVLSIYGTGAMKNYASFDSPFFGSEDIRTVEVRTGVTSIGYGAFFGCSNIGVLVLSATVTTICEFATQGCTMLHDIYYFGTAAQWSAITIKSNNQNKFASISKNYATGTCGVNANYSIDEYTMTLTVSGTGAIDDYAYPVFAPYFPFKDYIDSIVIEDGITGIGSYAFYGCSGLTSAFIPSSVKSIGYCAFGGCAELNSIEIMGDECSVTNNENTIPANTTIINHGSKSVYDYAINYNRSYICNHLAVVDNAREATCTQSALTQGTHCKACGEILQRQETIAPPLGHLPVDDVWDEPTCTEKGLKNVKCERCDVMFEEGVEVPALGHAYLQHITAPTCIAQGYTTNTCSRCLDSYISDYTQTIEHKKEQVITLATLNSDGVIKEVCSVCGKVFEQNIIYHPDVEAIIIKPHDEEFETGSFIYTGEAILPDVIVCDTMGMQLVNGTDYVVTLSNNVNVGSAKVTIRFKGKYSGSCVKQFTITPPEISISKLVSGNKSATISVNLGEAPLIDGYQIQYSTQTDFSETITITVKDLEMTSYSVKMLKYATVYYFRVRAYKTVAEINYFSAWSASKRIRTLCDHENYEIIESFVQNECLGGDVLVHCLDCDEEVTLYQDGLGHLAQTVAGMAPTCTQAGLSEGKKCERCGEALLQQEEIPALGHSWSSWQIITAPTCEKTGLSMRICNTCNQMDTLSIPALMHSFSAVTVETTCTHAGCTTYTCTACGDSYVADYVDALGHDYKSEVTKPTATSLGYTTHTCSRCSDTFVDSYTSPTGKLTLKHSARTANAIKVTWNNVKTATGYQVQISTKDGKKWDKYYNLKAGVTNYTFKSLAAGNAYKFRVRFYITAPDGKNYYTPWSSTLTSPTLPSGTTLTKLTAGKKAFTAQWKKNVAVTGYQIQYSTYSKFTGAKTVTVKNAKTYKYVVKNLKAKTNYYVRIRTYKTINKANYFSTWSTAVKVKTK